MDVRSTAVALALAGALVLTGCSGSEDVPDADDLPTPSMTSTPTAAPAAEPTAATSTCPRRSPRHGSYLVELDIMSGNPNPSFYLTRAETRALRALLSDSTTGAVDLDAGPEGLGYRGWIVEGGPSQTAFLTGVGLPREFRVLGDQTDPDAGLAYFLNEALGCRGTLAHVDPYPGTPD